MITRRIHYANDDSQRRINLGVDALLAAESVGGWARNTPFRAAFEHWKGRMKDGSVQERDIDIDVLRGTSHYLIDVSPENPEHYRFIIFSATGGTSKRYSDHIAGLHGTVVAKHPLAAMREEMMREYLSCKLQKQPSAYRLTHRMSGLNRDYLRLLLPLCDRRGNVVSLLGAARHLGVVPGSP